LADLAGSESSNHENKKLLKEGSFINKSLLNLTNVIKNLKKGKTFVNFRNSKLTRILKPVLTGNS